jgi:hypothetical protein
VHFHYGAVALLALPIALFPMNIKEKLERPWIYFLFVICLMTLPVPQTTSIK